LHCWLQWLPEFLLLDCETWMVYWLHLCLTVCRLCCTDGSEFLFLAATEREMEDWVNKISFHAKLPPSLQLLRYDDIQKVRWCEEQLLYRIMLEKHNIEDIDRTTNLSPNQPTKQLSTWSRALFKNLVVPELVKNLSMFCGMEIFISGVHNSPPLFFIMNHINSFHVLPSCFFEIHFNIPSRPVSSK